MFLYKLFLISPNYKTSGANEIIFTNFLARSSLATGPKIRVPTGSLSGLIKTAELSSKRMLLPSERHDYAVDRRIAIRAWASRPQSVSVSFKNGKK